MSTESQPQLVAATSYAKPGLSVAAFTGIVVWPLVVAALAYVITVREVDKRMEGSVAQRADVVVVDDVALIRMAIDEGADRFDPNAVMNGIRKIVERNGLNNTILLSQSMIMYAPPANRIQVRNEAKEETPSRTITK